MIYFATKALNVLKSLFTVVIILLLLFMLFVLFSSVIAKKSGEEPSISAYIVQTGSMAKTFKAGALIITVKTPPEKIKVRDIITFHPNDNKNNRVTHRVIAIDNSGGTIKFKTQGDSNNTADAKLVEPKNLVGKTIFWVNDLGSILNDMRNGYFIIVATILVLLLLFSQFILNKEEE